MKIENASATAHMLLEISNDIRGVLKIKMLITNELNQENKHAILQLCKNIKNGYTLQSTRETEFI
jgi:hypothetical protein